jgi:hypothetical protein
VLLITWNERRSFRLPSWDTKATAEPKGGRPIATVMQQTKLKVMSLASRAFEGLIQYTNLLERKAASKLRHVIMILLFLILILLFSLSIKLHDFGHRSIQVIPLRKILYYSAANFLENFL